MTEKKNEQGSEPGRPSWAAGLDLSPELYRAFDNLLKVQIDPHTTSHWVLRRLADAEMRIAELTEELRRTRRDFVQVTERGEPDFLIDIDGDNFNRVAPGIYHLQGGGGAEWTRDEIGDAQEFWK